MSNESRLSITIDSRSAEQQAKDLAAVLDAATKAGINVSASAEKAGKATAEAGAQFSKAGKGAKSGTSEVNKLSKSMGDAKSAAMSLRGALAGTFVGISIAGTIGKIIAETSKAEQEQAQLAAVLRSTGEAAGFSKNQLNDMAGAMSLAATVSTGEISQAQTTLLAFTGIVGEQFTEALQAAIDMSARTGMSVVSAAETIGRALDVPSQGLTALSRQGFRFTDEQKELAKQLEDTGRAAEAQEIVLGALKESYGGAAQAARDTFGGSITGLKNQLSDLMDGGDGSLSEATRGVNELSRTLASDETKQAFASFVSLVTGATSSLVTFFSTISNGSVLGWALTSGEEARNAEAEVAKLEGTLGRLRKTREALDPEKSFANKANDFLFGDVGDLDRQISLAESKLTHLRVVAATNRRIANSAINDSVANSGYGVGAPPPTAPGLPAGVTNPGFSKYLDGLQRQNALLQVQKEARVRLKVAQDLQGKATGEEIAKAQDVAVANYRLEQSQNAANKANTKADKEIEGLIKRLQMQHDVLGMTSKEAKIYEIQTGKGTQAQKDQAIALLESNDAYAKNVAIAREQLNLQNELSVFRDQQNLPITGMGLGEQRRAQLEAEYAIREEFARRRRELDEGQESESTRISEEAYQRRLAALTETEAQKVAILRQSATDKLAAERSWLTGAQEALINYSSDVANVYKDVQGVVSNTFKSMEDALTTFVTKGKLDFQGLADSILADLARIAVRQAITGPLASALGGLFGGGGGMAELAGNAAGMAGGDSIGAMISTFGPAYNAKGNTYNSPSLSRFSNGIFDTPQVFKFAKGTGVFAEAGPEAIMPLKRGPDGVLGVQTHTQAQQQPQSIIVNSPITINTPDANSFRKSQGQIARQIGLASQRAIARS